LEVHRVRCDRRMTGQLEEESKPDRRVLRPPHLTSGTKRELTRVGRVLDR